MREGRVIGAALLTLVAVYIVMRPPLVDASPLLAIAEYPLGILAVATAFTLLSQTSRAKTEEPLFRRHRQVERVLPDPDARRVREALESWIATGANGEHAAGWAARASHESPHDVRQRMLAARTPRMRERLLLALFHPPDNGA